jgi:hypothetical protein
MPPRSKVSIERLSSGITCTATRGSRSAAPCFRTKTATRHYFGSLLLAFHFFRRLHSDYTDMPFIAVRKQDQTPNVERFHMLDFTIVQTRL